MYLICLHSLVSCHQASLNGISPPFPVLSPLREVGLND